MVKNKRNNQRRRARYGQGRTRSIQLPSPFNRISDDATTLHCRGILDMKSGSEAYTSGYLVLTPLYYVGIDTLQKLVPTLAGMSGVYEKFIIANLNVRVVPTIPLTSGAIIAVGYEPEDSGENRKPTTLSDVMISKHHVSVNQSVISNFSVVPMNYRNDWCTVASATGAVHSNNGYVQWFSNYTGGAAGVIIGHLDVTFDIVFAGLHYTDV